MGSDSDCIGQFSSCDGKLVADVLHCASLHVEPASQVVFHAQKDDVGMQAELTLTNTSDSFIAFKVLTNAPKAYVVSPSKGTIAAGGQQSIHVRPSAGSLPDENHSL